MSLDFFGARAGDLVAWARRRGLAAVELASCCCGCTDARPCRGFMFPTVERPEEADLLIVSGPVGAKRARLLRDFYDRMGEPRWVIALGTCASSGALAAPYAGNCGADRAVPVDVRVPGCPPDAGELVRAVEKLASMIRRPAPVEEDDQKSD
ncbi:MAG: NADH-quinone oxidoreductase subunit B [Proteobacteria bacterium]|nr:NADH-quinone oxidoreductase subunit B [Pseudomonadota bacterium]